MFCLDRNSVFWLLFLRRPFLVFPLFQGIISNSTLIYIHSRWPKKKQKCTWGLQQPSPFGYLWEMRLFTISSVLTYICYQKYFFRIFSLFYCKVIEKVWGSLGRSQNSTDCILSQIRISILFMIEIKLTSSSSNFLFPIYFIQTQNGFKEKSSFLPFNILSCLCLGFKVFLVRIA